MEEITRCGSEGKYCPFLGRSRKRDKGDSEVKSAIDFFLSITRHVYDFASGTGQRERRSFDT